MFNAKTGQDLDQTLDFLRYVAKAPNTSNAERKALKVAVRAIKSALVLDAVAWAEAGEEYCEVEEGKGSR